MKNKFLIFLAFVGMIGFSSCEKDETRAILDPSPKAPALIQLDDIVLKRDNSADPIKISGSTADFGYKASILYILEAAVEGTDFAEPIALGSQELVNEFEFTVSSLNTILIESLPEDAEASLELRVRAEIISSGTGGSDVIESISEAMPIKITTFGPPSLYVTGDANLQRLVSSNDDGIYTGWVYTDGTAFTLTNKDDGKVYGVTGGVVTENGDAIALEAGGWEIEVNLNDQTIASEDVTIGIIGDAVGGWDNDTKMIWNFTDKTWNLSAVTVVTGGIKFRTHNSWAAVNIGYHPDSPDLMNLYQSNSEDGVGDSKDIRDVAPGTYDVKLSLDTSPMWVSFTAAK